MKNFLPLLTDLEMTCLTALTQHTKQRDSEAPSLRRLTTILPPSSCLLRLSARAHFKSERRWWQWQLKHGHSQRLERPLKKLCLIVMVIKPINSGMPYKPI